MYMFHGGSNFGYTSGAKGNKDATDFVPHTTSYDYDAPLNEAGDTTLKYWDIRAINRSEDTGFYQDRGNSSILMKRVI